MRGIEGVVLENDGWSRLSGIVWASGNGPDLATFHLGGHSERRVDEILLVLARTSELQQETAGGLSRANVRERVSGTQICTGRRPRRRRRAR